MTSFPPVTRYCFLSPDSIRNHLQQADRLLTFQLKHLSDISTKPGALPFHNWEISTVFPSSDRLTHNSSFSRTSSLSAAWDGRNSRFDLLSSAVNLRMVSPTYWMVSPTYWTFPIVQHGTDGLMLTWDRWTGANMGQMDWCSTCMIFRRCAGTKSIQNYTHKPSWHGRNPILNLQTFSPVDIVENISLRDHLTFGWILLHMAHCTNYCFTSH